MRYPQNLPPNGSIGFIAPSFGCAAEPYRSAFLHGLNRLQSLHYTTLLGPNASASDGIGISSTPAHCGEEINEFFSRDDIHAIISCGGGELMCTVLEAYKAVLEQGKNAREVTFESKDEQQAAHDLFLLTTKPVLYVCNVDEASAKTGNDYSRRVEEMAAQEGAEAMVIAAKTEEDIASLETYEVKQMFLEELGLEQSGVNRLIQKAYALLNLETFITAGEMEVKAWTYHKGWKAPQCAGVIHTDFEKGFIRAEVIKYDDYIKYGSETAVREAGKLGIEGKEYVVQDGDIMHFRFNG